VAAVQDALQQRLIAGGIPQEYVVPDRVIVDA